MISTITLDTYKQQIGSGDAFNLSDSFNGRVGDEQVPLVVQFKERGLAQQFQDGLVPFLSGFVGSLDENNQVTAETGEAVSYVGTSDDIVGLGRVKMNLPGTMFPQEGYFYGFLGLQNADGKRVTTFNVWFRVYNGNPDMFVNKAPFRTELQKLLDAVQSLINDANGDLNTWKQKLTDLFTTLSAQGADTATLLTTLQAQIKQSNLFTQGQMDELIGTLSNFKPAGSNLIDKLNNEFNDRGVNVKWFGAKGDGVTDDTAAFTEAYSIAKANATTVFVPTGRYAVAFDESNKPDNLRFWGYGQINNNGVLFQIATNQNLGINVDLQNPLSVSRKTFGSYNSAAAASVIANSATGKSAVMGINDLSTGLENYSNRDSVGLFVSNETNGLIITTDTVDFGVNYVDVNPKTDLTNVEVGMFVDTSENPKKTGIVKGITGNRITVNKWLAVGNGADNQVPATGSSVIINPMTAIWGQNTLVSLNADQTNVEATGHELDMQNNQPHRDNVDGYTSIIMGKYPGNAAYTARSAGEGPWRYGLYSNGSETGDRKSVV